MVDLSQTSVPAWAVVPAVEPVDPTGLAVTLLVIGPDAAHVAETWAHDLATLPRPPIVSRHDVADAAHAVAALRADLASASVGHRVLVAGSAEACLAVRAAALRALLLDDELRVGVVDTSRRTVQCVHCAATTSTTSPLDAEVACGGCARSLVVYAHVSRLTGTHLGFMADAELPTAPPATPPAAPAAWEVAS